MKHLKKIQPHRYGKLIHVPSLIPGKYDHRWFLYNLCQQTFRSPLTPNRGKVWQTGASKQTFLFMYRNSHTFRKPVHVILYIIIGISLGWGHRIERMVLVWSMQLQQLRAYAVDNRPLLRRTLRWLTRQKFNVRSAPKAEGGGVSCRTTAPHKPQKTKFKNQCF